MTVGNSIASKDKDKVKGDGGTEVPLRVRKGVQIKNQVDFLLFPSNGLSYLNQQITDQGFL